MCGFPFGHITVVCFAGYIFCPTIPDVERTSKFLTEQGLHVAVVHGGSEEHPLTPAARAANLTSFMSGAANILVGTSAAGCGIDHSGARWVICSGLPSSAVALWQVNYYLIFGQLLF